MRCVDLLAALLWYWMKGLVGSNDVYLDDEGRTADGHGDGDDG